MYGALRSIEIPPQSALRAASSPRGGAEWVRQTTCLPLWGRWTSKARPVGVFQSVGASRHRNSTLHSQLSFRQNDLRSPFPHRRRGERHEQILLFSVDLDFVRAEGEQEPVCADGAVWQEAKRPL